MRERLWRALDGHERRTIERYKQEEHMKGQLGSMQCGMLDIV
jgi:hypothetical protein